MRAPATQAALARWSACMSRASLHYSTPLQAALDPRWSSAGAFRPASTLAAESQTASADLACRGQAPLQQAFQNAEAQYQAEQLASHLTAIQQSLSIVGDWLRNASNAGVTLAAPHPANAAISNGVTGLAYFIGPVTYTSLGAGQRLDLWRSHTADGNKVDVYPINGGEAQNWLYSNTLSNGCRILAPNLNQNYAVQDPSGSLAYNAPVNIWYYGVGNSVPTWYTVSIGNASNYGSRYYYIQNCRDWLYLTANGVNGTQAIWALPQAGGQLASDQVWY
jgi:hypothetical protein